MVTQEDIDRVSSKLASPEFVKSLESTFAKFTEKLNELSVVASRSMRKLQAPQEEQKPNPMSAEKIRRAKARKRKRKNGGPR